MFKKTVEADSEFYAAYAGWLKSGATWLRAAGDALTVICLVGVGVVVGMIGPEKLNFSVIALAAIAASVICMIRGGDSFKLYCLRRQLAERAVAEAKDGSGKGEA